MPDWELRLRRWLSVHPRFKLVASAVRRRLLPAWRRESAAAHWDGRVADVESGAASGWLDSPFVEVEYVRPQVSGDPGVDYVQYFLNRHVPQRPVDRLLSLGCGGGNLERQLVKLDAALRIEGIDGSEASIRVAREMAAHRGMEQRIHYTLQDVNRLRLARDGYDVVVAKMALHHFEALEHIFDQITGALRGGGLLMLNEFVGPSRFQWSDRQLEMMNHLLSMVPAEIRRSMSVARINRPLLRDMIAQDPSESVRSAEIMPLLRRYFEIVELKPYGGTLLHIVLSHALPLLDLDRPEHRELLRSMMRYEESAIRSGALPSDFVYCVARCRARGRRFGL